MNGVIIADPRGGLVGVHVWDGSNWQKLKGDANGLNALLYGYDGSANRRIKTDADGNVQTDVLTLPGTTAYNNLLMGFSDIYHEELVNTNTGAGTIELVGTAVPLGQMWCVQAVHATNEQRVVRTVARVHDGTTSVYFMDKSTPAAYQYSVWTGELWLSVGQCIRCYFITCTAGDHIRLGIHGYKVQTL